MANIITGIRFLISIALLFCPAFSPAFFALYLTGGLTDLLDGAVARKTNTVSAFGSNLDTAADFVFFAACLVKLIPVLEIPMWIYIWIGVIALIKGINLVSGLAMRKKTVVVHTVMNKVTGVLLFVLPMTVSLLDLRYSAPVVCAAATFAAIQEGHIIRTGSAKSPNDMQHREAQKMENDRNRIETKRVRLYPAANAQMEAMIASETDDELKKAYGEMLDYSLRFPEQREWYAMWVIELHDGTHIGDLCFKGPGANGVPEIGYGISEAFRDRGYATEAVQAAVEWAFRHPHVTAVAAETDAENAASQRVLEKCGFMADGEIGEEGPRFIRTR